MTTQTQNITCKTDGETFSEFTEQIAHQKRTGHHGYRIDVLTPMREAESTRTWAIIQRDIDRRLG